VKLLHGLSFFRFTFSNLFSGVKNTLKLAALFIKNKNNLK